MKYFVISLSVIVLTVCSNKKISLNIDSCQILLTNEYEVNGSQSYGASSFLIKSKEDTLLCTAKHLLGEAMGISPEIKTDSFNSYDFKWLAHARNDTLSSDTFSVKNLITEEINSNDILLFKLKKLNKTNITPLTPRFSKIKYNEKLYLIGCEYSDYDCFQKIFSTKFDSYIEGEIIVQSKKKFEVSGFSGAPLVDKNGNIVGVLSGGSEYLGKLYLYFTPITSVKKWLN